ncbi:hypothetical protein AVEN_233020-1, partial [Araneus ventricosus]
MTEPPQQQHGKCILLPNCTTGLVTVSHSCRDNLLYRKWCQYNHTAISIPPGEARTCLFILRLPIYELAVCLQGVRRPGNTYPRNRQYTVAAQRMGDDEDESIYGEYEDVSINADDKDIFRHDFFRFTTRERYIWEDWTVPTRDPVDYGDESTSPIFFYYFFIPAAVCAFAIISVYICVKKCENGCCSAESDSHSSMSSNRFTTVHLTPQRRTYQSTQMHRSPIGRNQFPDSRRELFSEPAMRNSISELDINRGAAHATEATVSFINSTYASSTQGRREPDHTVAEKPPDYSTVTLS